MAWLAETNVLEILKRAKKPADGEVVPWNEDVREEALRRNAKAGYCTRNGEPRHSTRIMTTVKFGEVKYNLWPRDKNGNLIE